MTTIAFKAGMIAGDSCHAAGDTVVTLTRKIFRLRSGALFGAAGDVDIRALMPLVNSVKTVKALPSRAELIALNLDFDALLVLPGSRKVLMGSATLPNDGRAREAWAYEIDGAIAAVGTGADMAIGAMEAGATARQAVQIACRRDINSRPPVHSLSFPRK